MFMVITVFIVVVIIVDFMLIYRDAPIRAAADSLANRRNVAASANYPDRRNLRNEYAVTFGVGRNRVRIGRLRDGLDQHASRIDNTERRRLLSRSRARSPRYLTILTGAQIVTPVTTIEPDFIGASNIADVGVVLGLGVDDQRGCVVSVVARIATQQKIVVWPDRGTIWTTGVQWKDPGVGGRIEGVQSESRPRDLGRIDHRQSAVTGGWAGEGGGVATRRVVGDDRNRYVKARSFGIPRRLLHRQAGARWDDRRVGGDF